MIPKVWFERRVYDQLHRDGCDPEREHLVAMRIARAAFTAGCVARYPPREARPWVTRAVLMGMCRRAARQAWYGK